MKKLCVILMSALSAATCISAQPCENYECDSAVVVQIAKENNLDVPITPILSAGRVGTLRYVGLFSDKKMTILPECVGRLSQLQILDLSHNEISEIPVSLVLCSKLNTLMLNNNQISALPEELISLPIPEYDIQTVGYNSHDTTYSMDVSNNRLCSLSPAIQSWLSARADKTWRTTQNCTTAVMCRIPSPVESWNNKNSLSISVSSGNADIRFNAAENSMVRMSIFTPNGRLVAKIIDEYKNAGWYSLQWRIPDRISAGVYYIALVSDKMPIQTTRVVIRK